ncbi:hypothetical protein I4U23_014869 [Adineta vaga]|nr:hypothetical protein I4U23_014869 [Adineta vaga]
MTYTSGWMTNNYYEPMQALAYRFSPQGQREEALRRAAISQACQNHMNNSFLERNLDRISQDAKDMRKISVGVRL